MRTTQTTWTLPRILSLPFLAAALTSPLLAAPAPAGVQFGVAQVRVSEATRVARILVVRTGSLAGAVTAEVSTSDDTATAGSDYVGTNVAITLPAGVAAVAVQIPLLADTIHEANETVNLTLAGTNVGPRAALVLTILDNDPAGTFNLLPPRPVSETNPIAKVTVIRTGGSASEVSVELTTADGTATAGADYTALVTNLVFAAGQMKQEVQIPLLNDADPEGNETVLVRLANPAGGATLGRGTNGTVTILDDEITLSFAKAAYGVSERGGVALVTLLRSGPRNTRVSVTVSTVGGTATPGTEYKPFTNIVTFAPGVAARVIPVALKDDTLDDGDKTVMLALSTPTAPGLLGTMHETVVTIADNDIAGTISLSAGAYSAFESARKAAIVLRRTGGAASGVSVRLSTAGVSATAGVDYSDVDTNVVFKAGELVKRVFIPINTDGVPEGAEMVNVTISDPSPGVVLGTATAVLTLRDAPDPNAIPAAGPWFMSVRIRGLNGNPVNETFTVNTTLPNVHTANYETETQAFHPLFASANSISGTFPPVLTQRMMNFVYLKVTGVGVVQLTSNGANGGVVFTKAITSNPSAALAYGTGDTGAGGTVTIDVFDLTSKVVAGRFDFIMIDDKDDSRSARATGSFRVRNFLIDGE